MSKVLTKQFYIH